MTSALDSRACRPPWTTLESEAIEHEAPHIPGLWRILLGHDSVNAFLLQGEDGFTLVDCGYARSAQVVLAMMRAEDWSPQDIRRVVITHRDLDHMGGLSEIRTAINAQLVAHHLEIELIEGRCRRQWSKGLRGTLMSQAYSAFVQSPRSQGGPLLVDRSLVDDETLDGGWRVVHTPGHTPDHISLSHADEEVLLAGDLLGHRHGRIHGPRRWLATDFTEAVASVQSVAHLRPGTMCFGHLKPLKRVAPSC